MSRNLNPLYADATDGSFQQVFGGLRGHNDEIIVRVPGDGVTHLQAVDPERYNHLSALVKQNLLLLDALVPLDNEPEDLPRGTESVFLYIAASNRTHERKLVHVGDPVRSNKDLQKELVRLAQESSVTRPRLLIDLRTMTLQNVTFAPDTPGGPCMKLSLFGEGRNDLIGFLYRSGALDRARTQQLLNERAA